MSQPIDLVIFASRELPASLDSTLRHAMAALPEGSSLNLLVNGNPELAHHAYQYLQDGLGTGRSACRVWKIEHADKGNAWNEHIHRIWDGKATAFYIDGYVRVSSHAINLILDTLERCPQALASSGAPAIGRSAANLSRAMQHQGGFHGNFCSIRAEALAQMRARRIRLPIGLYRVDAAMGAFLAFGLDNTRFEWSPLQHVPPTMNAHWSLDKKSWWRPSEWRAWWSRRQRQAKGDIENAAVKHHLANKRDRIENLPDTVTELVANWAFESEREFARIVNSSWLHRRAMHSISRYRRPTAQSCAAVQVASFNEPK